MSKKEISQQEIDQLIFAITPRGDEPPPLSEPSRYPEPEKLVISGNLDGAVEHPGPVRVEGRFLRGGSIKASGPVTVAGGISFGFVFTGEGLASPYIEFATVISRQTVLATSHILGSDVVAVEGIYCSPRTGSFIAGGRCRSFSSIQADILGSPLGVVTRLELVDEAKELWEHSGPPECADPYFRQVVALEAVRNGVEVTVFGDRREVSPISGKTSLFP